MTNTDFCKYPFFSQWIQGGKSDFYYANWINGREKGEVDLVWIDKGTQKASSVVEIKWSDRYADNPTELKSLFKFVNANKGLKKIIVTSQTRRCTYLLNEGEIIQFIPAAIYAYWIVENLFRANGIRM